MNATAPVVRPPVEAAGHARPAWLSNPIELHLLMLLRQRLQQQLQAGVSVCGPFASPEPGVAARPYGASAASAWAPAAQGPGGADRPARGGRLDGWPTGGARAAAALGVPSTAFAAESAWSAATWLPRVAAGARAARAALRRMDEGRYGRCLRCGERLSRDRLLEQPAAALCEGCAARHARRSALATGRRPEPRRPARLAELA